MKRKPKSRRKAARLDRNRKRLAAFVAVVSKRASQLGHNLQVGAPRLLDSARAFDELARRWEQEGGALGA